MLIYIKIAGPDVGEAAIDLTLPFDIAWMMIAPDTELSRRAVRALGFQRSIPPRTDAAHRRARGRWWDDHWQLLDDLERRIEVKIVRAKERGICISLEQRPQNLNLLTDNGRLTPFARKVREVIMTSLGWERREVEFAVAIACEGKRVRDCRGPSSRPSHSHHRSANPRRAA